MAKRGTPGRGAGGRFIKAKRRPSVVVVPRRRRRARRARAFVARAARRSRYPRGGRQAARLASLSRRRASRVASKALQAVGLGLALGMGGGAYALAQSNAQDFGDLAKKTGVSWLAWVGAVCLGVSVLSRSVPARFFWVSFGACLMGSEAIKQVGQALSAQGAGQSDFSLRWMSLDPSPAPAPALNQGNQQKFDATRAAQEATKPTAALDAALADLFRSAA